MKFIAQAHWKGSLKKGKGTLSTQSGAIKKAGKGILSRLESEPIITNPEELLAATHAGCFTMAVCANLTQKGYDPAALDTLATVIIENQAIAGIHLFIEGKVKDISEDEFIEVAKHEERNCIISKALQVPVSTEARLVA